MSFYASLRDNTATPLISEFGVSYTFSRTTKGAYDPATGSTSGDSTATFTALAVRDEFSAYERSDSSIQINDIKFICEAVSEGFQVGDHVEIEGIDYQVMRATPIKPANIAVAWELQVRA